MASSVVDNPTNVYSALSLCHGVYIAEFDQLKGPMVLLDRPKCFENARFKQVIACLPRRSTTNNSDLLPSSSSASSSVTSAGYNNTISSSGGLGHRPNHHQQHHNNSHVDAMSNALVETQGRLLETADRIARRLLAGSVGDSSDFLELPDNDDDEGDDDAQQQKYETRTTTTTQNNNQSSPVIILDDEARVRRHHFFSCFLDAVPVSRKTGPASYMDVATHSPLTNQSFALSAASVYHGGSSGSHQSGGHHHSQQQQQQQQHSGGAGGRNSNATSSSHKRPRVYVQNDAGLDSCVVCACTFALPDVFARGYRRDVTIFAICPRLRWSKIAPCVAEALRVFGTRMCDNAMSVFYSDVAKVAGALTRVHHKLQTQEFVVPPAASPTKVPVKKSKVEEAGGGSGSGSGNNHEEEEGEEEKEKEEEEDEEVRRRKQLIAEREAAATKRQQDKLRQQHHFKIRRTEEEYAGVTGLAKRLKIDFSDKEKEEAEGVVDGDGNNDDDDTNNNQNSSDTPTSPSIATRTSSMASSSFQSTSAASIQQLYMSPSTIENATDEWLAARCRSRGTDPLRTLADLCPIVWEEDAPTSREDYQLLSSAKQQKSSTSPPVTPTTPQSFPTPTLVAPSALAMMMMMTSSSSSATSAASLEQQQQQFIATCPVVPCGPRHWEAGQVLLSKYSPVHVPASGSSRTGSDASSSIGTAAAAMLMERSSSLSSSAMTVASSSHHHHHHGTSPTSSSGGGGSTAVVPVVAFQFQGKFHETKWNLRGYLYTTVLCDDYFSSSSCSSGLHHRMGHYKLAALSMQQMLPSVFLPTTEMFPTIRAQQKKTNNNNNNNNNNNKISSSLSNHNKNNNNNTNSSSAAAAAPDNQQSGTSNSSPLEAKLYSDGPGQYYRKYRAAVEALPEAARECVLPTVALFPAFCERSGGRF